MVLLFSFENSSSFYHPHRCPLSCTSALIATWAIKLRGILGPVLWCFVIFVRSLHIWFCYSQFYCLLSCRALTIWSQLTQTYRNQPCGGFNASYTLLYASHAEPRANTTSPIASNRCLGIAKAFDSRPHRIQACSPRVQLSTQSRSIISFLRASALHHLQPRFRYPTFGGRAFPFTASQAWKSLLDKLFSGLYM